MRLSTFRIQLLLLFSLYIVITATENERQKSIHVRHYRIDVSVNIPEQSVTGTTSLIIKSLQCGLDTLKFDAEDMTFDHVIVGDEDIKNFSLNDKKIIIPLSKPLTVDTIITVMLSYRALPEKGLYFYPEDQKDPRQPVQVWSQGEGTDNHHWFPCLDIPNDKATVELVARVENGFTAVSNGSLIFQWEDNGKRVFQYRFDDPTPAYLVTLIVGDYQLFQQKYGEIPVQYYVYPHHNEDDALRSFGRTPDMLQFFSDYTGYEYPYNKYTQTIIWDFMYSGMENISATTITDRTMHDERAGLNFSSDGLVAHELAHQWFGDLVTCREWGDVWLNEGFATIFTDLYMEHHLGKMDYEYGIWRKQQIVIKAELKEPRRLTGKKNWGVYIKGASVLHMLRRYLGDDLFRDGINRYLNQHEFDNAGTLDLCKDMEEATGYKLGAFFEQWTLGQGIPEFNVRQSFDSDKDTLYLEVEQIQDSAKVRPVFDVHLNIGMEVDDKYSEYPIHIEKRKQKFAFAMDEDPEMLVFDAGQTILKKVDFKKSLEQLQYELSHATHLADKLQMMNVMLEMGKNGDPAEIADALAESYENETFYALRSEAIKHLAQVEGLSDSEVEDISGNLTKWAKTEKDARVRQEIIKALAKFPSFPVESLLKKVLEKDESYNCQAEALNSLIAIDTTNARKYIETGIKMDSWDEMIRARALKNLHYVSEDLALTYAKHYAFDGSTAKLRGIAIDNLARLIKKGNSEARKILFDVVRENNESNRYRPVSRSIYVLSKEHDSKDKLYPILISLKSQRLNRYVRQSVERILKEREKIKDQ